jgi:hypothetical protein
MSRKKHSFMRLDPAQNDIPLATVKKNPLKQIFSTPAGQEKRGFLSPIFVGTKQAFNIDNSLFLHPINTTDVY